MFALTTVKKQLLKSAMPLSSSRGFSGHDLAHKEIKGRMKVTDKLVWLNVVPPDGIPRRVGAWPNESLLDALQRHKIQGIFGDCQGGDRELPPHEIPYDYYSHGVGCGTCQVVIPDPWYDQIHHMPNVERKRLDRSTTPITSNSRLACCVKVRPDMEEMIVVIGHNKSGNSEFFSGFDPAAF